MIKWIGERISFLDDKSKTTFVIYPEDITWHKALMGGWFAMWLCIGATMAWAISLDLSEQEFIIVLVFLTFWAYYAFRVGRSFFWILWGREMLKVNETALFIKKSVKGFGKTTPYYIENIRKIRVEFPKENSIQAVWEASPWIRGGERLEFDYLGKTIRFGRKLNEKDAKLLFSVITKRIEDQLKIKEKKRKSLENSTL
jgi:hypothetical protein